MKNKKFSFDEEGSKVACGFWNSSDVSVSRKVSGSVIDLGTIF